MEKYTISTKIKEIQNFQQLNYLILVFLCNRNYTSVMY